MPSHKTFITITFWKARKMRRRSTAIPIAYINLRWTAQRRFPSLKIEIYVDFVINAVLLRQHSVTYWNGGKSLLMLQTYCIIV